MSSPATTPGWRARSTSEALVGRDDRIGGDVAGASEVFEQGGSNQRLVHDRQKRGKRHGWALPTDRDPVSTMSRRRRARPQARWKTARPRAGRRENRCGNARRGFPRAGGGDCDHQSHERGIGSRAAAVGERIRPRIARPMPCWSRSTPRPCDRIGRTAEGSDAGGGALAARVFSGPRLAPWTLSATHWAQTMASISELLASRLAPCSPVRLTSPQAQRPSTVLGLRYPPISRPCDNAPPASRESDRSRDRCRPSCRRRK